MKPDPTRNTRAAKYRAASKTAGGARVDVHIGPEAAAVLARMRETMTVRVAIEEALRCCELLSELLSRSTVYCSAIEADHDFYLDEWEARLRRVGTSLNSPAPAKDQK